MNLDFDIRRSIILSQYLQHWGLPETREIIQQGDHPIELYLFPGEDVDQVSRIATIGLSSCHFDNGLQCHSELLMVLPFDIVSDQAKTLSDFLFNIAKHLLNSNNRTIPPQNIVLSSHLDSTVPSNWPKALLFDDPIGEPDTLHRFYIGTQNVQLRWVVPIFESEYHLIKNQGMEAFDQAVEDSDVNLVDPKRQSCV